jgi:hypothetical protein
MKYRFSMLPTHEPAVSIGGTINVWCSGSMWLTEQWSKDQRKFHFLLITVIKEQEGSRYSYLSIHISRAYFLCYRVPPPILLVFCIVENILKKGTMPHLDLQLNTIFLYFFWQIYNYCCSPLAGWGGIQTLLGSCVPFMPCVDCTDTDWFFYSVSSSAGIHMSQKMNCFAHSLG